MVTPQPTPTKLLVASTWRDATHIMTALALDPAEWMPCGFGQALTGHRFEKIVVVPIVHWRPHEKQWALEVLPLKLPRDVHVHYL